MDLSAAHALVRAFSVESAFATSDLALARALADDTSLNRGGLPRALARYANELADVCTLRAGPDKIGHAQVFAIGTVVVIRPGKGTIALPPNAELLTVDLRNLPAMNELTEILPQMVAPAMTTPVAQPTRLGRVHHGTADEVITPTSFYSTSLLDAQPDPLPASGARDIPIVLVVGERIAPQAAAFAAALRAARRAWIAGQSVPMEVAEAEWEGVGSHGLAVRTTMSLTIEPLPREVLIDQSVSQDDQDDPTTASYRRPLTVESGLATLDVIVDGPDGSDLDLYLVRDVNGDGAFDLFTELAGISAGLTADERVTLGAGSLVPGDYQIFVHGWDVPSGTTTFTLTIDRKNGMPLPDLLTADFPAGPLSPAHVANFLNLVRGRTPPPLVGPANRPYPIDVNPFGFVHETAQGRGEIRAALLAAHGSVRRFFRYFPIVGDTIDQRLLETLDAADAHDGTDRIAAWRILRRFGEALHDGHQFVFSNESLYETALPVFLEHIDGRPVVRRSLAPGVNPGDAIVALDGRPINEVYEEELARTSAASLGYKLDIANRYVYLTNGPQTLTLEDPDGHQRTVTIAPQPYDSYIAAVDPVVSGRPSGALTDLGAPTLYYLNLHYFTTPNSAALSAALAQAQALGSTGLVVDMRGYPGADAYTAARRLVQQPFLSPIFTVNQYSAPHTQSLSTSQYTFFPLSSPSFNGPIVLLTGPHAVSAAENFMQMLVGADRPLAVVGQQSASTNGNITGLALPGGFAFTYTGMEVRNPDGSNFHGTGIVPDVEVSPTQADLRDGVDPELMAAIAILEPGP